MNSVPGARDKEHIKFFGFCFLLCHKFTFTAHLSSSRPHFMLLAAHTSTCMAVVLDRTGIERALGMLAVKLGSTLLFSLLQVIHL